MKRSTLITHVTNRPGHDLRYAIDSTKLQTQLHWHPATPFELGIERTVRWYLEHWDLMETVNGETISV